MSNALFYAVRHGETAGNKKGTYRSWSNGPDAQLDASGKEGIRDAGLYLKSLDEKYDCILCDDLDRTNETAEILSSVLNLPIIRNVKDLKPLDVGDFTGKSKKKHPLEEYMKDKSKRIPGGESVNEFNHRQASIFEKILDVIIEHKMLPIIVVHGSNVSFLHNHATKNTSKEVGYEGLTKPGGVLIFTSEGITALTKKKETEKSKLIQIERWGILFVSGKDTNGQPKSCFNCPHMYKKQETCAYMNPNVILKEITVEGKLYTPVCGYQIGGLPTETDSPTYMGKDPEELGLEWAQGTGTNCYGHAGGAPCEHFIQTKGDDGICELMTEDDNEVDSDDCCAAHKGPAMDWKIAQAHIKSKED